MLRLTRVVRCALITSSSSLFSTSRDPGNGHLVERKTWPLTSTKNNGRRGSSNILDGIDTTNNSLKNGALNNIPLDFDFVSSTIEGNITGNELLSASFQDRLQFSHSRHLPYQGSQKEPTRRKSQLPSSSSSVLSSLSQQVLRGDIQNHLTTKPKRRKRMEDVEEITRDEDNEMKKENELGRGMAIINGHHNSYITSPRSHHNHHNYYGREDDNRNMNTNDINSSTVLSNPFCGLHDHITRSYRLDQLLAVAQPEDVLLGRQETKSGAFSFIRFKSSPQFLADSKKSITADVSKGTACNDCSLVVAERLLAFPPHMRHFHSICGREDVPCDFFADVDLPNETVASGEKLLLEMLNYLEVRLQGIGFIQPSFLILTNEVPGPDKVSYHIHARSMGVVNGEEGEEGGDEDTDGNIFNVGDNSAEDLHKKKKKTAAGKSSSKKKNKNKIIAFQDYRVVKLLADEVNMTLGRTVIDDQCYRSNGMLRCAFSSKIISSPTGGSVSQKGKRLVPLLKAQDTMLQRRLNDMSAYLQTLSEAEILERSFSTRFVPLTGNNKPNDTKNMLRSFKLVRARHVLGPKETQPVEFDAYGNAVSTYLTEGAKWRRFKTVIEKLRRMPPSSAESYDLWVRVGLALHNFSNEDHVFEEWVRFSLKCPQKYSRESCRKKWQQFERNPDALNWRRGFNYLNTTVWRSVRGS